MKLNDRVLGLPKWPPVLYLENENEHVVQCKHATYGRYILGAWLFCLTVYGAFALIIWALFNGEALKESLGALILVLILFIVTLCVLPTARLLSRFVFPRETRVRFTPKNIIINNKPYEKARELSIQFRANRPSMPEEKFNRLKRSIESNGKAHDSYKLKFRKIEMVYGGRVVPITSIADQDRAEQFVIALQAAHSGVGAGNPGVNKSSFKRAPVEEALPE